MSDRENFGVHPGTGLIVGDRGTVLDPVNENQRKPWEGHAGTNSHYQMISYAGEKYHLSRLVWETHRPHETIGTRDVSHINGDRADNRVGNLRLSDRSTTKLGTVNLNRNATGFRGVADGKWGKWKAQKTVRYKHHHLGSYETPEEAARAHDDFAANLEGMTPWGLNYPGRHFSRREMVEAGMNPPEGGLALWRPVDYANIPRRTRRAAGGIQKRVRRQEALGVYDAPSEPTARLKRVIEVDWLDEVE